MYTLQKRIKSRRTWKNIAQFDSRETAITTAKEKCKGEDISEEGDDVCWYVGTTGIQGWEYRIILTSKIAYNSFN